MALAAIHHVRNGDINWLSTDYYEYLSNVHEGLFQLLKTELVDEIHIFALFIIIEFTQRYCELDPSESEAFHTYVKIFSAVLQRLIQQHTYIHRKPVWRFVVTCLRRMNAYRPQLTPSVRDSGMLLEALDMFDAELPGNYNFEDLWVRRHGDCTLQIDDSLIHSWNVEDMILSLKTGFKRAYLYQFNRASTLDSKTVIERETDFIELLHNIRYRSKTFEKFQYIDQLFEVRHLSLVQILNF